MVLVCPPLAGLDPSRDQEKAARLQAEAVLVRQKVVLPVADSCVTRTHDRSSPLTDCLRHRLRRRRAQPEQEAGHFPIVIVMCQGRPPGQPRKSAHHGALTHSQDST